MHSAHTHTLTRSHKHSSLVCTVEICLLGMFRFDLISAAAIVVVIIIDVAVAVVVVVLILFLRSVYILLTTLTLTLTHTRSQTAHNYCGASKTHLMLQTLLLFRRKNVMRQAHTHKYTRTQIPSSSFH